MGIYGISTNTLTFIILLQALTTIFAQSCQTPYHREGNCLPVKECTAIVDALSSRRITLALRNYLLKSVCPSNDGEVRVCCPLSEALDKKTVYPRSDSEETLLPRPPNCGQILNKPNAIYSGNEQISGLYEYPWLALIEYTRGASEKTHFCTGTLINKRYVLTAAHCTHDSYNVPTNFTLTGVRLGEWDTTINPDCINSECAPPYQDYDVESIIVHPEYRTGSFEANDIALLKIGEDVIFTESIQPICLPTLEPQQNNLYVNQMLETTGWNNVDIASSQKQKGTIKVWSEEDCVRKFSEANVELSSKQICANSAYVDNYCNGDSGSPLMSKQLFGKNLSYVLAGVLSFGPAKCNDNNWPNVYTRTGSYMQWLKSVMIPSN